MEDQCIAWGAFWAGISQVCHQYQPWTCSALKGLNGLNGSSYDLRSSLVVLQSPPQWVLVEPVEVPGFSWLVVLLLQLCVWGGHWLAALLQLPGMGPREVELRS